MCQLSQWQKRLDSPDGLLHLQSITATKLGIHVMTVVQSLLHHADARLTRCKQPYKLGSVHMYVSNRFAFLIPD